MFTPLVAGLANIAPLIARSAGDSNTGLCKVVTYTVTGDYYVWNPGPNTQSPPPAAKTDKFSHQRDFHGNPWPKPCADVVTAGTATTRIATVTETTHTTIQTAGPVNSGWRMLMNGDPNVPWSSGMIYKSETAKSMDTVLGNITVVVSAVPQHPHMTMSDSSGSKKTGSDQGKTWAAGTMTGPPKKPGQSASSTKFEPCSDYGQWLPTTTKRSRPSPYSNWSKQNNPSVTGGADQSTTSRLSGNMIDPANTNKMSTTAGIPTGMFSDQPLMTQQSSSDTSRSTYTTTILASTVVGSPLLTLSTTTPISMITASTAVGSPLSTLSSSTSVSTSTTTEKETEIDDPELNETDTDDSSPPRTTTTTISTTTSLTSVRDTQIAGNLGSTTSSQLQSSSLSTTSQSSANVLSTTDSTSLISSSSTVFTKPAASSLFSSLSTLTTTTTSNLELLSSSTLTSTTDSSSSFDADSTPTSTSIDDITTTTEEVAAATTTSESFTDTTTTTEIVEDSSTTTDSSSEPSTTTASSEEPTTTDSSEEPTSTDETDEPDPTTTDESDEADPTTTDETDEPTATPDPDANTCPPEDSDFKGEGSCNCSYNIYSCTRIVPYEGETTYIIPVDENSDTTIESIDDCVNACDEEVDCVSLTFQISTQQCTLYADSVFAADTAQDADYISAEIVSSSCFGACEERNF